MLSIVISLTLMITVTTTSMTIAIAIMTIVAEIKNQLWTLWSRELANLINSVLWAMSQFETPCRMSLFWAAYFR